MLVIGMVKADGWEYRRRAVGVRLEHKVLKGPEGRYYLALEDLPPVNLDANVEQLLAALAGRV